MAIRIETTTSIPLFFYPQSRMALYNNRLLMMYKSSSALKDAQILLHPSTLADIYICEFKPSRRYILSVSFSQTCLYFVRPHVTSNSSRFGRMIHYDFLTPQVRQLQRVVGHWVKERMENRRRIALAMGLHDRLGCDSLIQILSSDLLALLMK
jgi:hypothetical protein